MKSGEICCGHDSQTATRPLSSKPTARGASDPSAKSPAESPTESLNRGFARGVRFERHAEQWLTQQGLTLIERNFRARGGEIDLVMRDGQKLVFVEVRKRRRSRFGSALESITPQKVSRIRHAAETFIKKNVKTPNQPPVCRFDVVTFDGEPPNQQLRWIRNAF